MGGINLNYPAGFTSAVLIADTVSTTNASTDSIAAFSRVGGNPVSACLELQSTRGALLLPRMTTVQRDLMTVTNGMFIYNTTTNTVNYYVANAWADISVGSVDGPAVSAIPNVPVFNNLTGSLLADSGIRLFGFTTNSVYLGTNTGNLVATGLDNTIIGSGAGEIVTTTSESVFLGKDAGSVNTVYTQCTLIGNETETSVGNLVNATALGYQAEVGGSNCLVLGKFGTNVGIGTVVPAVSLHVVSSPGVYGGVIFPFRASALANVNIDFTDHTVLATNVAGGIVFFLPVTNANHAGQNFVLKTRPNISATIRPQGGQDLDGNNDPAGLALGLNNAGQLTGISIEVFTDGTGWYTGPCRGTDD